LWKLHFKAIFMLSFTAFSYAIFCYADFSPLVQWFCDIIAHTLKYYNFTTRCSETSIYVFRNGHVYPFKITKACTYIDLFLASMPAVWLSFEKNRIVILCSFFLLINLINYGRVCIAIFLTCNGWSWFWSHDILDWAIWYPVFLSCILMWFIRNVYAQNLHFPDRSVSSCD